MSVEEVLRRAVEGIRDEHGEKWAANLPTTRFMLAVADWLDEAADHLEDQTAFPEEHSSPTALEGLECSVLGQALKSAQAYLASDS